jgi:dsDNA-specific endonuclease/ATPase MutS2
VRDDDDDEQDDTDPAEELAAELTDELDLHTFRPQDVPELVPDYLDECVARGFAQVRIIHGKGRGTLRRMVHAALERHPAVTDFTLADGSAGSWGATIVTLRPR